MVFQEPGYVVENLTSKLRKISINVSIKMLCLEQHNTFTYLQDFLQGFVDYYC